MRRRSLISVAAASAIAAFSAAPACAQERTVYRVPVTGVVELGMAPHIERSVEEAAAAGAVMLLLEMDTPGGRVDAAYADRVTPRQTAHPLDRRRGRSGSGQEGDIVHEGNPQETDFVQARVGGRFEHEHGAALARPILDQLARGVRADLFIGAEQEFDAGTVLERGEAVERLHDSGQHVEHTGAGGATVADVERAASERPQREHGVVMTEQQHPRVAAARPVHMRAREAVDQSCSAIYESLYHLRQSVSRPL